MNNNFDSIRGLDSQNLRTNDAYGNMDYFERQEYSLTRKMKIQLFAAIFSSVFTTVCLYFTMKFFTNCYMQSLSVMTVFFWLFGILSLLSMACASYFWDNVCILFKKLFAVLRQHRGQKTAS